MNFKKVLFFIGMFLSSSSVFAVTPKGLWVYGYGVEYKISYVDMDGSCVAQTYNGKDSVTTIKNINPNTFAIVEVVKDRNGESYHHVVNLSEYGDEVSDLSMNLNAGGNGSKPQVYTKYRNPEQHKI